MHITSGDILRNLNLLYLALCGAAAYYCLRTAWLSWQDAVKLDQEERGTMQRLLGPLAKRMAPQTAVQVRELRLRLARAGILGDAAVRRWTVKRAAALAVAAGFSLLLTLANLSFLTQLFLTLLAASAALRLPEMWLERTIKERQRRLNRALPSTIDLMVLCLDVGLSIEAAFDRVTTEMRNMEPLMADEAQAVVGEMGAGLTFPQALKRMADRVDIEELSTLSRLINQASSLGASVTTALREYSESAFQKRMMALEEHAGKITAFLVMPLTMCMLPACILALIGPSIVSILKLMRS